MELLLIGVFFKIHDVSGPSGYRTLNPYSVEERYLYFISDPPHLIKTVRNWLLKGCCG